MTVYLQDPDVSSYHGDARHDPYLTDHRRSTAALPRQRAPQLAIPTHGLAQRKTATAPTPWLIKYTNCYCARCGKRGWENRFA